jgi:hypothetical protein
VQLDGLPGAELVRQGLIDLAAGEESTEALLVAIAAPRLARAGITVPAHSLRSPEHRLYERLAREDPRSAHSRYNALLRRLVRFEHALECGS